MKTNEKLDFFAKDRKNRPNKFTIRMGELIRASREEVGLSQEELAKKLYMRRPTLSDIENGKVEIDASTIELLSYYLRKPISYFFPKPSYEDLVKKDMDELSLEMQMHFEQIYGDDLRKLAIKIIKVIENFNPSDLVKDLGPELIAKSKNKGEIEKFLKELTFLVEE